MGYGDMRIYIYMWEYIWEYMRNIKGSYGYSIESNIKPGCLEGLLGWWFQICPPIFGMMTTPMTLISGV